MKIQPTEKELAKFFFANLDAWYERIEPSRGMHTGIPDALVMTEAVGIMPVEFKIGSLSDNTLHMSEVRPAQIGWHKSFAMQNKDKCVCSLFVVGVWSEDSKSWSMYAFEGIFADMWEDGIPLDDPILYHVDSRFVIECLDAIANDILDCSD